MALPGPLTAHAASLPRADGRGTVGAEPSESPSRCAGAAYTAPSQACSGGPAAAVSLLGRPGPGPARVQAAVDLESSGGSSYTVTVSAVTVAAASSPGTEPARPVPLAA